MNTEQKVIPVKGFQVGDYLYTNWGYDQTNIEFYRITRRTAKTVAVVRVECERNGRNELVPTTTPMSGIWAEAFTGKRIRPISEWSKGSIKLDYVRDAWPWDGTLKSDTYTYGGAGH